MTAVAFSSDGSDAINKTLDNSGSQSLVDYSVKDIEQVYEVQRSAVWINDNTCTRVALQFPDDLLPLSTRILSCLRQLTPHAELFILADTSYGSCCVDEVAAEHVHADSLIHYGHACLSQTQRIPVLYIFGQPEFDIDDCCQKVAALGLDTTSVILFYDVCYSYKAEVLFKELTSQFSDIVMSWLSIPNHDEQSNVCQSSDREGEKTVCHCGKVISFPASRTIDSYSILYIGAEGLSLTNLMYTFNKCSFYTYNPAIKMSRKETLNISRSLMKRYYLVERAKDARIVGIVVGTLAVSGYLDILQRLKSIIKTAGKKSYTLAVGKPNVAKLANFMEIDIFVLVACPENTLLDSKDFYRPVVTPFELELACNWTREWKGDYVTDFSHLLPGAVDFVEMPDSTSELPTPDVSLVTGKLRSLGVDNSDSVQTSTSLIPRNEMLSLATTAESAGEFLSQRSWTGLEKQSGKTAVSSVIEGQTGIAAKYNHEPQTT